MRGAGIAALLALIGFAACNRQPASRQQQATPSNAPTPCEDLAKLSLPNTTITLAERVPAGAFMPPPGAPASPAPDAPKVSYAGLPPFCRVAATVKPVPDSEIRLEVWMPLEHWNGKFVGTGNGGAAGFVFLFSLAEPLARGYAVANTNTGHEGGLADWSFAVGHAEKLIDHGYRAIHEMTVKSKAIVAAHYGTAARQSYWTGCSTGGRQGLMEAHRFPEDYDGIAASAPANNWVPLMAHAAMIQRAMTDPAVPLPPEKLTLVKESAIAACDAADGVRDRVVSDPQTCKFDPGVLQCPYGDGPNCLTPRQIEAVKRIYRGVVNPRTGEQLFPGPEPTSELLWPVFTPAVFPVGRNYFRDIVFNDPAWDLATLDFDADITRARKVSDDVLAMTDPDLTAFVQRGGKLLLWHGWTDGLITPRNTINYYNSVVAKMGADKVTDQVRLFMAPGVNHCSGGEGPSTVDYLSALEQWVEDGKAPERIIASGALDRGAMRTRPLCPYPQIAKYKGQGNPDDAANFECVAPKGP
jgi:feruloyl esterase